MTFTKMILDQCVQTMLETSEHLILHEGFHVPLMTLFGKSGKQTLVMHPVLDDDQKDSVAGEIVELIKKDAGTEDEIVALIHIHEAWMAECDSGDVGEHGEVAAHLRPINRPGDRVECLLLSVETATGTDIHHRDILRDEGGKVTGLGPVEFNQDAEGRFCNLLHEL